MKYATVALIVFVIAVAVLLVGPPLSWTQQSSSPIERYRNLQFRATDANFDKGWHERVAREFAVINDATTDSLRAALKDENPFVRSVAARALGIRQDKASAEALAEILKSDPEYFVRIRAVESLAYLKMKAEVVEWANNKDPHPGVPWAGSAVKHRSGMTVTLNRGPPCSIVGESAPDPFCQN